MKLLVLAILLLSLTKDVRCHGVMVLPHSWFDYPQWLPVQREGKEEWTFDFVGSKSGMQCRAGCKIPKSLICNDKYSCEGFKGAAGCSCLWYTNNTVIRKPTIFDSHFRTFARAPHQEKILFHPWRAPGSAPLASPCGVSGGNLHGCAGEKCNVKKGGFGFGPKAEDVDFHMDFHVTEWYRGSLVEVVWGIVANHGGGYSYRLCKMPEAGVSKLTEECFQNIPLDFVGDKQWVQYGEDKSSRIEINATRVTKGTFPKGSQWTKNPIPACVGNYGGFYNQARKCLDGLQFQPSKSDLWGFGVNSKHTVELFKFSIVDLVRIPEELDEGDYVLSFRWDCEQTPQVWNTCASIHLN